MTVAEPISLKKLEIFEKTILESNLGQFRRQFVFLIIISLSTKSFSTTQFFQSILIIAKTCVITRGIESGFGHFALYVEIQIFWNRMRLELKIHFQSCADIGIHKWTIDRRDSMFSVLRMG